MPNDPPKTPRRRLPFLFWVGMFLMTAGGIGWLTLQTGKSDGLPVMDVELGGKTYQVEMARTRKEQSTGLMFRQHLDQDKGMLFVYDDDMPRAIWMKNTKIPLDILFFSGDGTLLSFRENAPPCKADPCPVYPSGAPVRYILELPGGQAKSLNLTVGDKLTKVAN